MAALQAEQAVAEPVAERQDYAAEEAVEGYEADRLRVVSLGDPPEQEEGVSGPQVGLAERGSCC